MEETEPTPQAEPAGDRLQEVYALIWRAGEPDDVFDDARFQERIPRLMEWLRGLHAGGHLVACGGGGFENHMGGLTLIRAGSHEQAIELSAGSPMNEIGHTEIFLWDVYFADLSEKRTLPNLVRS
ncbi:MAG: hypothetical protein JST22_20385 [Bacteroidetes bacterium]|nr:hypothetical protein [Bacteroidota bacterium]